MNPIKNEPVVTVGTVVGALGATLVMLVSLGIIQLTEDQQTAILACAAAILPIAGAFIARSGVKPVE